MHAAACLLRMITETWVSTTFRARELGVPFDAQPGVSNSITDVPGVAVGHRTLISGGGPLTEGDGPVRTGVTVIHPRFDTPREGVFAGWATQA